MPNDVSEKSKKPKGEQTLSFGGGEKFGGILVQRERERERGGGDMFALHSTSALE